MVSATINEKLARNGRKLLGKFRMTRRAKRSYSQPSQTLLRLSLQQFCPTATTERISVSCYDCGIWMDPRNGTKCKYCQGLDGDPLRRLHYNITILHCRDCQSYSYEGTDWYHIIAPPQSQQLLDFLLKRFKFHTDVLQLVLKNACFWPNHDLDSLIIKISAHLVVQTPNYTGPSHRRYIVEFDLVYQACPSCSPVGPLGGSSTVVVVQLRQYGTHKLARLNLERHILRHPNLSSGLMNFKKMDDDQGTDVFISSMRGAMQFTNILSAIAPIKLDKTSHGTAVWVCPIGRDDLVYLPPNVSASLGNLGPLVICTNVTSEITLLDPFQLRESSLSADEYWKAPFEPLMTSNDLVEFVVVDADVFGRGTMYSLADIHAYRLSDFGENCESFSVRTHLGGFLQRPLGVDHIALGYDLCREKCRDLYLLPDVVLIRMRDEEMGQFSKPVMKQRMLCQKYGKFLRGMEMNPRATCSLLWNSGNDEINGKSDMGSVKTSTGENVDIGLEVSLAHLDLGDNEGDTSMK